MAKMVKDLWDLDEIRYRLLEHMVHTECGTMATAKNIGVALNTLKCFLAKEKSPSFKTLSRIVNYLNSMEERKPVVDKSGKNAQA